MKVAAKRLKVEKQKAARLRNRTKALQKKLAATVAKNTNITEDALTAKIAGLPPKQREAVRHIFESSWRRSTKGMRYSQEWVLECLMMKMKSSALYEHLRKEKILAVPRKTALRKYLKSYKTGFGFNMKVFDVLREKTSLMDEFKLHGGLLVDEMKLSEHLSVNNGGHIGGFVDLGPFTSEEDTHTVCDHGMAILFVPFVGKWTQVLAAFATKNNIKGTLLAKIMLETVILAQKSGLKVDFIASDGATWNRKMWSLMRIHASTTNTKCSAPHPVLCLRNGLLTSNYKLPEGDVSDV
ncbi:uncharacterized protein LOC144163037 [Haemaphysalis longicornis]